jgi:hypothetical protein
MGYCRQAGKAWAKLPRIVCAIKGRRQSIQRRRKGYGRLTGQITGQQGRRQGLKLSSTAGDSGRQNGRRHGLCNAFTVILPFFWVDGPHMAFGLYMYAVICLYMDALIYETAYIEPKKSIRPLRISEKKF